MNEERFFSAIRTLHLEVAKVIMQLDKVLDECNSSEYLLIEECLDNEDPAFKNVMTVLNRKLRALKKIEKIGVCKYHEMFKRDL